MDWVGLAVALPWLVLAMEWKGLHYAVYRWAGLRLLWDGLGLVRLWVAKLYWPWDRLTKA
jgi:hypothetical protein